MECYLVKQNGRLYPADQSEAEKLNGIEPNKPIKCKLSNLRNYENHKRFFALMNLVFENQDKYESLDVMRKEIIMRTGRYISHHHLNGAISYHPQSISFDSMQEDEFKQLFSDAINVCLKHFCTNMTEQQLWEVASYG